MEIISEFFSHFMQPDPKTALLVILNLILIESILSVDNAAVLATMVMGLPPKDRSRALRIGLVFAYIFRGTALVSASYLIQINWLKLLGGGYLLFLCLQYFYKKIKKHQDISSEIIEESKHRHKAFKIWGLNAFWSTVVMVELMDLTFSLDNVFAAVAFTDNIYLVCLGVFIGIITMRIVAGYFVKLMARFPFLDTVAFLVIGMLGLKLCFHFYCEEYGAHSWICEFTEGERSDLFFSLMTVAVFVLPIAGSLLFGFPKKHKK